MLIINIVFVACAMSCLYLNYIIYISLLSIVRDRAPRDHHRIHSLFKDVFPIPQGILVNKQDKVNSK